MLKRGSVPVVLLVILTVVVFTIAIASFTFVSIKTASGLKQGYTQVQDYNLDVGQNEFVGDNTEVIVRVEHTTGWLQRQKVLDVSVTRLKN